MKLIQKINSCILPQIDKNLNYHSRIHTLVRYVLRFCPFCKDTPPAQTVADPRAKHYVRKGHTLPTKIKKIQRKVCFLMIKALRRISLLLHCSYGISDLIAVQMLQAVETEGVTGSFACLRHYSETIHRRISMPRLIP